MRDLTEGSIHKNFLIFSVPIIISSVLSSAFGVINTAIAGLFLGAKGLAATSATSSYFGMLYAIFFGFAYGMAVYMGNLFGAKNFERLKKIMITAFSLLIVSTVVIGAISLFLWRPLFDFMNIQDDILADSLTYFRMMCLHLTLVMLNHFFITACNAIGETKFPLFMSILSSSMTIGGNFIAVGVFDFGVFGIGVSNIVAGAVVALLYTLRFRRYFREMNVHKLRVLPHWRYFKAIVPYSVPNIIQQASMYLAGFIMSPVKNALGYAAIAALSIASQIGSMCQTVYYASAKTSANYIAQCVGAKKYDNIRRSVGVAFTQGCLFFLPILIFMWLCPDLICALFIDKEADPTTWEYTKIYIRYFMPLVSFNMACGIFHSVFRGIKANKHLVIASTICTVSQIVVAYAATPFFGIYGQYASTVSGYITEAIYVLAIYFTGHWVPRELRPLVLPSKSAKKAKIA